MSLWLHSKLHRDDFTGVFVTLIVIYNAHSTHPLEMIECWLFLPLDLSKGIQGIHSKLILAVINFTGISLNLIPNINVIELNWIMGLQFLCEYNTMTLVTFILL